MSGEQVLIGSVVSALSVVGIWNDGWFLKNTSKGQRLVAVFGERKASWIWRTLMAASGVFGVLLACDIIHPVRWD